MLKKIILSADSTCDLGKDLKTKYDVHYFPFHILLGDKSYKDSVDITPEDIYSKYRQEGILPKTAAIGIGEYVEYFKKWVDQGYEVIHINLGSALSSAHQNCCIAAKELGNIYPINSCSLSTGTGHLVIEAAERIAKGLDAKTIQEEVIELTKKTHASFILDSLEFMHAGGRCSSIAALGANFLKLKPCIEVDNTSGKMAVGKKYRGDLDKVLIQYVNDKMDILDNIRKDKIFITHAGIDQEKIDVVCNEIKKIADFENIYVTKASCTISSHCGPNTIGVLFMTK